MTDNKIVNNIKKAKLYISICNTLAAFSFYYLYTVNSDSLYLIVCAVLILTSFAALFLFSRFEKKFAALGEDKPDDESKQVIQSKDHNES